MGCGDVEGDWSVAFTGVFGFGGGVEVWWGRGVPVGRDVPPERLYPVVGPLPDFGRGEKGG